MTDRERVVIEIESDPNVLNTSCGLTLVSVILLREVLTLLKDQEPRVLALEKIQSGTVEVAWLECSDKEEVRAGLWFKRINEGEDEGIIIHVLDGFEGLRTEVYGKTWRCWSARPTEEQRKAAAWDG